MSWIPTHALHDHFDAAKFLQERTGLVRVFGSTVMVKFRVAGRPSTPTGVIRILSQWLASDIIRNNMLNKFLPVFLFKNAIMQTWVRGSLECRSSIHL